MRSFFQLVPVAVAIKALLLFGNFGQKLSSTSSSRAQTAFASRAVLNQSCLDTLYITLDANCQFRLTGNLVLEGMGSCLTNEDVDIFVDDEHPLNHAIVDGCGAFRYVVKIKNQKNCTNFESCWGIVVAEDKTAPQVIAPANLTLYNYCDDLYDIYQNLLSVEKTGVADLVDNCSKETYKIRAFIDAIYATDDCERTVIRRVFFASDAKGNQASGTQFIHLVRPPLSDIQLKSKVEINTCTENKNPKLDANGNIHPELSGYPYIINHLGEKDEITIDSSCGVAATYVDTRLEVCPGTYKLERRWLIRDWCRKSSIELKQLIKVGDVNSPVIRNPYGKDTVRVSTSPFDCRAVMDVLPPLVSDLCSSFEWTAEVWSDTCRDTLGLPINPLPSVRLGFTNSKAPRRIIGNLPIGCHLLIYSVRDNCENEGKDTIRIEVKDLISPIAVCDDKINLSLNEWGYAQLRAEDVDEGSKDNCKIAKIHIRRPITLDENCNPLDTPRMSRWDTIVHFNCCDLNTGFVKVELRVTDAAGNTDYCWSTVWIEDKMLPRCQAPKDLTVYCDSLPKGVNFSDVKNLHRYFGAPSVFDNCAQVEWIEFPPVVKLNNCGVGTIQRKFIARDIGGNQSVDTCRQVIKVIPSHEYLIKFPKDYTEYCKTPTPDTIGLFERACDILAVNVTDKRYSSDGVECYKIFRTYSVINWCEYKDGDPIVTVPRDVDCDGKPGDEDIWVIVRKDSTVYDADNNERNKFPEKNTLGRACGGLNPEGYWVSSKQDPRIRSTGHWQYTQIIRVVDVEPPVLTATSNRTFCIDRADCNANIVLAASIEEACNPNNLDLETDLRLEVVENSSSSQTNWRRFGRYPKYFFTGVVPKGEYELEIRARDACDNVGRVRIKFSVVDCKPPSITCLNGLSAELTSLPPNTDIDGDGDIDRGVAVIWAKDLLVSPGIDSCSGPVRYSINRKGAKPNINQDHVIFTCDDFGLNEVELHAWDSAINPNLTPPGPNHDYCITTVRVQDNKYGLCKDPGDTLIIQGNVRTELGLEVSGVIVNSSGARRLEAASDRNGDYRMDGLAQGYDYTLSADKADVAQNGVTTQDLFFIQQHILGRKRLTSPYQLLAADVNGSGTISTADIIKIRRVVLTLDATFEGGKTWLFVDAKHQFKDPNNPWAEALPTTIQFNDLERSVPDAGFIGIKLGDVNGNVEISRVNQVTPARAQGLQSVKRSVHHSDFSLIAAAPNPFREQVQLHWNSPHTGDALVQIMDALGRTVRTDKVSMVAGENTLLYQQTQFPGAGTYTVLIQYKDQLIRTRIVMMY